MNTISINLLFAGDFIIVFKKTKKNDIKQQNYYCIYKAEKCYIITHNVYTKYNLKTK